MCIRDRANVGRGDQLVILQVAIPKHLSAEQRQLFQDLSRTLGTEDVYKRQGLDGREFMMIKFRSMRTDAEKDGPGWTVRNDPRQTRLGTWLRRLEVDELPNLINVWLGEMSLVGPRPEQAYYVEQFRRYVPRYMDRHREKGGMTGWAQVNGLRGDSSISERTKYDLWYSENWSILLDTKILLRTLWQVITPKPDEPRY